MSLCVRSDFLFKCIGIVEHCDLDISQQYENSIFNCLESFLFCKIEHILIHESSKSTNKL